MTPNTEQFSSALQTLNPAQREAVDTIYGSVLVVAGPGTGKTQVLAMRIANILKETDSLPQNILALTFTESGAVAMRKRLLKFIGPDAHSVNISTFHSFCQDLISEFPEKFLFARKLELIDDLNKIQLLKNILENSNIKHLRPLKQPNFFLKDIQTLISSLKREGVSPEDFLKICHQEKNEFESIPEAERTNPKTGKIKGKYSQAKTQIEKNFELHTVFTEYQNRILEQGYYDFDDMILFVTQKMESDEDFLWSIRERFLFVLIDEFQDTNGSQMKLIELFAGEEENPNVFAVGDDDQSVYRFQGASLENILYFQQKFPKSKIICLTENYRSTQNILDVAQGVIEHNEERLTKKIPQLDKNLVAVGKTTEDLSFSTTLHVFSQEENEHFFLSEKIREFHGEKVPYSEMVILVRNNREGFELLEFLEGQHIPVTFSGRGNALKSQKVQQILSLLKLIENPEDDSLFFKCLHYSFFEIPIEVIWELWEKVRKNKGTGKLWKFWRESRFQGDEFVETGFKPVSTACKPVSPEKFNLFCDHLSRWHRDIQELSLAECFQKVCTESGLLESLARKNTSDMDNSPMVSPEIPTGKNLEDLNHINALFGELKRFSHGKRNVSLTSFLEILELREELDLPLPEKDIHTSADTVQILTAHKSKGLEFKVVFVIHCQSGIWGDKRNSAKITLPEGILHFDKNHDANEEERRLFFVACTRAKKHLILTRSEMNAQGREKPESRFLSEIPAQLAHTGEAAQSPSSKSTAFETLKSQLFWNPTKKSQFPAEFLRRAVSPENFSLSHSAFENFRENPQKFLWENILQIPQVKHPSALLGIAIHKALEEFSRHLPNENISAAQEAFRESLEREILTEKELREIQEEGWQQLSAYLEEYKGKFLLAYKTELNFRSHRVFLDGEIPLTGKVDKIEWISKDEKTVKIVDYKTTIPQSENEIRGIRDSDSADISAGRYFRQMVFYSLLCNLSPKFPESAEIFEIDFLLPNSSGTFKKIQFQITEEDQEILKNEIRMVWKKIQKLDFTPVNLWGDMVSEKVFGFLENETLDTF